MLRIAIVLVCLTFVALALAPPSAPVSVGYVHSESMEPAIAEGDGYLLGPIGTIQAGDIITFYSDQHGEYVTHRVVEITDVGLLTKGDGNRIVDQANNHPPIAREDVVGRVVTVGSAPVTIPQFGTAIEAITEHRGYVVGVLLGLLVIGLFGMLGPTRPIRPVYYVGSVVRIVLAVVFILSVAMVLVSGSSFEVTLVEQGVVAEDEAVRLEADGTATLELEAGQTPLMERAVTAEGAVIEKSRYDDGTLFLTIRPTSEASKEGYTTNLQFYAYPAVLPTWLIEWLQAISPWLAAMVTMGICYLPFYLAYRLLLDGAVPIRGPRVRPPTWGMRR